MKFIYILLISIISLISCSKEKTISKNDLPFEIKVYISEHFPNNPILQASVEENFSSKEYEVILKDNITVEFDAKDKVKEIKANTKLPNSVIAKPILDYVKTNFRNNIITKWELDKRKQEVKINNGISLEFDLSGNFIKIDD
ncbi:MAG: PepSY-like domain-containing protein [Tenacibaculum sp.]|nr:PepSY-like domain-containing protein [Tenacibaculum sp.]